MKETDNYSNLAPLYDKLMENVDYESWADYIDEIIQEHHPEAEKVLELACGTGSVAISLEELGYYEITAGDLSPHMIEVAKEKASKVDSAVQFKTLDFLNINIEDEFDVIFSVFDSVNYLQTESEVKIMLDECRKLLKEDGLLIFDFSTPLNSMEAVDHLNNEEAEVKSLRFFRTSEYDAINKIHTNTFEIEQLSEDKKEIISSFKEVHKQRIYSLEEMLSILKQTPYHLVAKYGDFDLIDADENSARITLVLKCQKHL
ncbi:MAG TPA: class I SAM-dependent methyltransferase [Balneola sp.]|nr:SAM-dependent methyltransferase [Bacteroidota bacterium]HCI72754.1 class I SAM-dependent methyltransferase [Balneola sp.]HCT54076.1 class I SAM-dependent methyltransferase [Balneola sp.]|tara:strand:+ start:634 stop:1410 length:777 start_codon:yes stop_codon:yes gene_type:complete